MTRPVSRVPLRRLPIMVLVALLHLGCYWSATRITAARPPEMLVSLTTPLDPLIPYLPWTWPFYWITYPFVIIGCGAVLLQVPPSRFRRGIAALVGVTLFGALVQVLLPAVAPWPADPAPIMRFYHNTALVVPYANLPSMHVTYVTITAGLLATVSGRPWVQRGSPFLAAVVVISTVTLKEHVVLDALAGLGLGGVAIVWWRKGSPSPGSPE